MQINSETRLRNLSINQSRASLIAELLHIMIKSTELRERQWTWCRAGVNRALPSVGGADSSVSGADWSVGALTATSAVSTVDGVVGAAVDTMCTDSLWRRGASWAISSWQRPHTTHPLHTTATYTAVLLHKQQLICNNNNNNNRHDNVYGAVIVAVHCHCGVHPVHLMNVACSARWPPTFGGPSRSAWANRSTYRQL